MKLTPEDGPALMVGGLLLVMAGALLLAEPFVDPPRDDLSVLLGIMAVVLGVVGIFRGAVQR